MTSDTVWRIGEEIDLAFVLIGLAILAIEIVGGLVKRTLKWRGVGDMVASASTQIPSILMDITLLTAAYGLFVLVSESWITWTLPFGVWTAVLAVLVADFIYYWEHRIAHETRILWLQHAVHHSSRHMNIVTAIRFGPLEGIWTMITLFPMVLLGFPPELVIFGSIVVLAYQTWIHTELIGKLGPVEWVMNTASHHRVHHGCDEKYLDRNYGGILIIWDRMFGTFKAEEETPRYGLKREFDSVNPLVVWFSEWPGFFKDLANARGAHEVWMRVFGPPNWTPPDRPDSIERA